jgi:acyl CoA:acetate/3-ketoacid CoA transferase beta subunit
MNRADICVIAIAECFRGDADLLCNPIGICPIIGGRLAKATFAPDVVTTDAVSVLTTNPLPLGVPDAPRQTESYVPYRTIFDIVWSGKRHVMMGATQIDRFGNQNIAAIGDFRQPKVQLLGLRGAPGNLINHRTSYWVPNHSERSFVEQVDVVSGPGYDRMREVGAPGNRFHDVHRVVSNLGVFSFETPDNSMKIHSIHPGVTVEEVVDATAFDLVIPDEVAETRTPTGEELELIEVIDPHGLHHGEVPS